jgi:hypothetical protein
MVVIKNYRTGETVILGTRGEELIVRALEYAVYDGRWPQDDKETTELAKQIKNAT